jgi:hypothetical protein
MQKDIFEQRAAAMRARLLAQRAAKTSGRQPHEAAEILPAFVGFSAVPGLPNIEPHQSLERVWKPAYTKAVLTALPGAHALVIQTAHEVGKSRVGFDGLLSVPGKNALDTHVSLPCLARALHAYDVLLQRVERLGGAVALAPQGTVVHLSGETEIIRLREGTIRHRKAATDRSFGEYTYEATGLLYLVVLEPGNAKCKTLIRGEDDVAAFLGKLQKTVARRPAARAKTEERERLWQAEQERRKEQVRLAAEARRQWDEQQQRFDAFFKDVARWEKAARARAYLLAFTQEHERLDGAVIPGTALDGWLRWLHWYADELDPFTSTDGPGERP